MTLRPSFSVITSELADTLATVPDDALDAALALLRAMPGHAAPRVFVVGEGRSGQVMRMFAVRLMHLGLSAHVIGETVTPGIATGDVLVACSGSGTTAATCLFAESAAALGARVIALTAQPLSRLAACAEIVVPIPAPDKSRNDANGSRQYGASLFEQAALIVCDALVYELQLASGATHAELWRRHANME